RRVGAWGSAGQQGADGDRRDPGLFGERRWPGVEVERGDRFGAQPGQQVSEHERGDRLARAHSAAEYDDQPRPVQWQHGPGPGFPDVVRPTRPAPAWDHGHMTLPARATEIPRSAHPALTRYRTSTGGGGRGAS